MSAVKALTERLDRLERQNRKLRLGLLGTAVTAALCLLVGAVSTEIGDGTFKTVEAQKLAIVDGDGKERLVLELDAGEPALTMLNHAGMQQVYLGISENWNDSAYLSVCSRRENGSVDKQAVLVATKSQTGASAFDQKPLPGNAQLVLYDLAPQHKLAAGRHLVRISSGRLDEQKPYLEIREFKDTGDNQLNFDVLTAAPESAGQRFLLDTTSETTTISGVE